MNPNQGVAKINGHWTRVANKPGEIVTVATGPWEITSYRIRAAKQVRFKCGSCDAVGNLADLAADDNPTICQGCYDEAGRWNGHSDNGHPGPNVATCPLC